MVFYISVNLDSIVKILKYLEQQPSDTTINAEHIRLIQSVFESNGELRRQIMKYLNNLNVQIPHLEPLHDLFLYYNPNLLFDLNKTAYLIKILNGYEKRSCDFYTIWFQCFLCDEHYAQTEQESQQFHQLLKEWWNKFRSNGDLLEQMSMKINTLLDKLAAVVKSESNDRRLTYFIKHMIDIYIQESKNNFILYVNI